MTVDIIKKALVTLTILFIAINVKAQHQKFDEGFIQVHKEMQAINPLLFENKGVAKPISKVPWKQKELLAIEKGTIIKVLAYEAKASIFYIYFVFIQNEIGDNSIEVYEVDYADHKPYKVFSFTTEYEDAESWSAYSDNEVIMKSGYLYFDSDSTDDSGYYYKFKYKLGEKSKVEDAGYLEGYIDTFYRTDNHTRTASAEAINGELSIIYSETDITEIEFVTKGFENGFYIGNLSWSLDDKILYFDNYASGLACIWRYNIESKELSKIVPEHDAEHPFAFTYNYKEYVFYIEENTIKVATSKKKARVPKITDPIGVYEKSKLQTLVTNDFEIAEIKRSSDRAYTYVTGTTQYNSSGTQVFSVFLIEKMSKIVSKISMKILGLRDYTKLKSLNNINIDAIDEAMKIPIGDGDCCHTDNTILFFRKKDQLINGLQIISLHGEEGEYDTRKIITSKNLLNQIWIENTVGHTGYEDDSKHNYFINIEKYKFQNDSLVLMNPKQEDDYYYIIAKNGLNARNSPYFSGEKIKVLDFGAKVKVLNKTDFTHELWDGSKLVKGNWVQIEIENNDEKFTAYVFDGYLNKELVNVNTDAEATIANGEWRWYYTIGQLGELGFYKNGEKDGKWKWFFKNGALKAIGSYKDGKPVGQRKWYYNNDKLYCTGQYSDGKKDGGWLWYSNDKPRLSITFDKGNVAQFKVFDKQENEILKTKNTGISKVAFTESYDYRHVFEVRIENPDDFNVYFDGHYMSIGKRKNNKKSGESKSYENGKLKRIAHYKAGLKTGKWEHYLGDEERLHFSEHYKNDKRTGKYKYYHNNGQLQFSGKYSNGIEVGNWKSYYDNGQIKRKSKYILGNKDGKWKMYYENGQLMSTSHYKDDKYHGEYLDYYENGKIKEKGNYSNGNKEGNWKAYRENGILKELTPYKNDKIHGEWTEYDDDQILMSRTQIKDGDFKNLHKTSFYPNGQIRAIGSSDNGSEFGEWKLYYENGQQKEVKNYKDGKEDGEWKLYYESGQLKAQGQFIKGDRDGKFIWYKEDGKIKDATEYKYNSQYVMGEWKYFDNGNLESVELYQRDELVEWRYYYESGQLKEVRQYYKKRTRTGEWKYYYKSGQLRLLAHYNDEIPQGEFKLYHENGQLYKTQIWEYYKKLMKVNSCFDAKGNALNIGTLKNGTGTVNEYNAKGELINTVEYIEGKKAEHNVSLDDAWNDSDKLNSLAWKIYEEETYKVKLDLAIKWVQRSIELGENYYNTDTYAALLYKTGKYKQALKVAKNAIKMAKKTNTKYKVTQELIDKINMKLN